MSSIFPRRQVLDPSMLVEVDCVENLAAGRIARVERPERHEVEYLEQAAPHLEVEPAEAERMEAALPVVAQRRNDRATK